MEPVIDENPRVTLLDADSSTADDLPSLGYEADVDVATTLGTLLGTLDDTGCVVTRSPPGGTTHLDVVEAVRARDPDLPVVVYPQEGAGGEALAGRMSTVDATRYLPTDADDETVAATVRDALETYERRRSHRRDHTILRSLFEEFPYHVFVKDEDARHVAMTDIPNVPDPEEVVGKTDLEAFSYLDEAREMYRDDLEVIESGEPVIKREEHHHAEDIPYWAEVTKVPWRDGDGRIRGLVGSSINVNERKALERRIERRRTLHRRIARYLAHDIRNPLTLAHGHLELARDSIDPDRFETIEDALHRIEAVVDNMDVVIGDGSARGDEGLPQARLGATVADAWETVEADEATLRSDVPAAATVLADASPLQELLENLFRNAVEHGGRDVTVRVDTLPGGFYVADDGRGLADDAADLMGYGVTTDASGSGLGLAIVGAIADTYGWSVDATESADGGARFEVTGCQLVARRPDDVTVGDRYPIDELHDIGDARPTGTARRGDDAGSWVVSGGGENVWRDTNEHHFACVAVDGDVRVTGRLTGLERVEEHSKAGVMLRTGLGESDPFGFVGAVADHGSEVLWRPSRDEWTASDQFDERAELPTWYRIRRVGEAVTVFVSEDGDSWTPVDQRRLPAGDRVYAGLAVCSHDTGARCDARFDAVTVESIETGRSDPA